jgi:hypothetical protein
MSLRHTIKITVKPEAKTIIKGFAEKLGMAEIAVASRIYEWFAAQDDVVRKGVLQLLPENYEKDVVRIALERMANGKGKK